MKKAQFALAAMFALSALPAGAVDRPRFSTDFGRCIEAAGAVDPAVMACQAKEWERQDKRLNLAYQKLLARLPAKKGAELRGVQRAWVAYALAKCKFYYDGDAFSGTMHRQSAQYCEVEERASRADELEDLAQW